MAFYPKTQEELDDLQTCDKCGCKTDTLRYNERTGEEVCEYCSESYDPSDFDDG